MSMQVVKVSHRSNALSLMMMYKWCFLTDAKLKSEYGFIDSCSVAEVESMTGGCHSVVLTDAYTSDVLEASVLASVCWWSWWW